MKLFFDTEFTGLKKETTLVSIGIIAENNEMFYAELTDYDQSYSYSKGNEWFRVNVENNLLQYNDDIDLEADCIGTKEEVKETLAEWLRQFEEVQFVSDVCHFDFVLLTDLFGSAFDLPANVSPTCYDINQDIAAYKGCSQKEAFDISRERLAYEVSGKELNPDTKHNAFHDALLVKIIYEGINKKKNGF